MIIPNSSQYGRLKHVDRQRPGRLEHQARIKTDGSALAQILGAMTPGALVTAWFGLGKTHS